MVFEVKRQGEEDIFSTEGVVLIYCKVSLLVVQVPLHCGSSKLMTFCSGLVGKPDKFFFFHFCTHRLPISFDIHIRRVKTLE